MMIFMDYGMSRLTDLIFFRNHHLCPRWLCFTFDNGLRRLVQNPDRIIKPYVHEGDTVLDVGPGIGYFTIPIARAVGSNGRVIAADLQESMLKGIFQRAVRAGLEERVILCHSGTDTLNVGEKVDFAIAFWMLHEVQSLNRFMAQLYDVVKPGGKLLVAEPRFHVSRSFFQMQMEVIRSAGFNLVNQPDIPLSSASLFSKF